MERLNTLTNEPFDLTKPPLFRARLFKLSAEEHVLLFVPHHMIWDGWSFDLFYEELAQVYEAFLAGRPSPLKPLPISYGDFAAWHRQWLEGPDFAKQIGFWRERLADVAEVSELPADKPRRPGMSGEGATEWIRIDKATTEALRELSRRADTTLFMTLLTIYYVLLARVSGRKNLVVGTPVRGRNLPEVERVMGYFTNLLPLHLTVDRNESFIDLLKRVKATVLDSFANPDVPLESLMRELTVQRGEGGSLLYQALFSFQDARHRVSNWGGLAHEQILLFQRGATEDLGLWFLDNDRGMVGGITYNSDIIDAESARLLRDRYLKLVGAVLGAAETPVGRLKLELDSDAKQLRAFAGDHKAHAEAGTLHGLFEASADKSAARPAAFVGGWSVSYQDIEAQANRIAQTLVARGVTPGTVVALCEEPGQSFLAGLLAILKARRRLPAARSRRGHGARRERAVDRARHGARGQFSIQGHRRRPRADHALAGHGCRGDRRCVARAARRARAGSERRRHPARPGRQPDGAAHRDAVACHADQHAAGRSRRAGHHRAAALPRRRARCPPNPPCSNGCCRGARAPPASSSRTKRCATSMRSSAKSPAPA